MYLTATYSPLAYVVFIIFAIPILIGISFKIIPRMMQSNQTLSERLKFGGPVSNSMPLGMGVGFAIAPLSSWCLRQPPEMTWGFLAVFVAIMIRRLTVGLSKDLKEPKTNIRSILINRVLYDRSYF
jgi:pheromone shutdown protein TraB